MSKVYNEKVALIQKFMANEPVERMPFLPSIQTWGIGYGGGKCPDIVGKPAEELKYYGKCVRDIPTDGVLVFGLNRPDLYFGPPMGYCHTTYAEDGVTVIVQDDCCIMDDEVETFAKDPLTFWREIAIPRRYPEINKPYPENVNAALGAIKGLMAFGKRCSYVEKQLKKEYDTPMVQNGFIEMPFDHYVMMRGFAKSMTDLRRHSDAMVDAMDNIYEITKPNGKLKGFPYQISPMTSGTYLNGKMFDKYYWPTCKKVVDDIIRLGGKIILFLEGKWGQEKIEHFLCFPKGTVMIMLDEDDPVEVKQYVGDRLAILGGFPASMLKGGTPEEVKQHAYKMIEAMGNRGMAMSIDKCLLSPVDAKAENVIALGEACRDYRF